MRRDVFLVVSIVLYLFYCISQLCQTTAPLFQYAGNAGAVGAWRYAPYRQACYTCRPADSGEQSESSIKTTYVSRTYMYTFCYKVEYLKLLPLVVPPPPSYGVDLFRPIKGLLTWTIDLDLISALAFETHWTAPPPYRPTIY